ncbi:MAG: oligogalacturonate lyase family protein [Oscillospiraceae bacterium]|jgi:oligogalacturonide lyase|nr:oligogalacturonate lyase family protein [Oscillospiraceae bacterium]
MREFYPGEKRALRDPLTGRTVWQLTTDAQSRSLHLYFTENSFIKGENAIIIQSDRDTPGVLNLFRMDMDSGDMHRLTHVAAPDKLSNPTKNPDGTRLLYWINRTAVIANTQTGEIQPLYTAPDDYTPARISLSCDGCTAVMLMNENAPVEHGINYAGFKEKMYRVKRSMMVAVPTDGSQPPRIVLRDTHEAGHLQCSPTDADLVMFCHEGPWHLVQQRIYLLRLSTGELWPCFRQSAEDSVGHEFFTQDGLIFFDNRGPGHDGTITSDLTQAVATEPVETDFIPYVGLADGSGQVLTTYPMPFYMNHYHANPDHSLLVGDAVRDLSLIDLTQSPAALTPLCHHGTSWHGQETHCHPTFSWDGKQVLFASDQTGKVQVYCVDI